MNKHTLLGITAALVVGTGAASASVTAPVGLNPGDPYRIAFITSDAFQTNALSSDIADYNLVATNAANSQPNLAALNTTWYAIVSTPGPNGVDAKINTGTDDSPAGDNGVPIFLVDGSTKIADHYDDLWDSSIDTQLDLTETGAPPTGTTADDFTVWSGTLGDGTINTAQPLGGTGFFTGRGQWGETDTRWIAGFPGTATDELSIYAISDVLTAAAAVLAGDYNADGSVDQGDLDLVLLNWGDDASQSGVPAGWVNQQPAGLIGQTELDGVLLNWGNTAEAAGSSVPEPGAAAWLAAAGTTLALRRRR